MHRWQERRGWGRNSPRRSESRNCVTTEAQSLDEALAIISRRNRGRAAADTRKRLGRTLKQVFAGAAGSAALRKGREKMAARRAADARPDPFAYETEEELIAMVREMFLTGKWKKTDLRRKFKLDVPTLERYLSGIDSRGFLIPQEDHSDPIPDWDAIEREKYKGHLPF